METFIDTVAVATGIFCFAVSVFVASLVIRDKLMGTSAFRGASRQLPSPVYTPLPQSNGVLRVAVVRLKGEAVSPGETVVVEEQDGCVTVVGVPRMMDGGFGP